METDGLNGLRTHILKINRTRKSIFPLDLILTDDGIEKWLRHRVLPRNRANADAILKTLGLSWRNIKDILDKSLGLSLNDSYWVVPLGFEGSFQEYNLYENRFSSVLSLVAYTGVGQSHEAFTTSPELTTQGMLRKTWRFIEGDGIYLYKGGTEGAANAGREPYSEYYACQIAERMGLHAVHYDLENWKDICVPPIWGTHYISELEFDAHSCHFPEFSPKFSPENVSLRVPFCISVIFPEKRKGEKSA